MEVLPALVPLAVALLGPDQDTETQRQMMAVLRKVAGPQLEPYYKDLVPSICSIVQVSVGGCWWWVVGWVGAGVGGPAHSAGPKRTVKPRLSLLDTRDLHDLLLRYTGSVVRRRVCTASMHRRAGSHSMRIPSNPAPRSRPPRPLQDSAGPTKLAAERTLARVLQLDSSPEPCAVFLASGTAGALARTMLTEAYQRRLSRLPPAEEEDAQYAF